MANVFDVFDTPPAGQSAGAQSSGASKQPNVFDAFDPPAQLGWAGQALNAAENWAGNNLPAFGKLAGRTGIHLLEAPADLLTAGSQVLGHQLDKTGFFAPQPPPLLDTNGKPVSQEMPSQAMIDQAGLTIDPNAGTAMRVADFVAPFLATGGRSAISRIGEAEGLFNKTAEGLGYLTGAGIDAGLSAGGASLGQQYGGDDGAFLGSLLGGGVRPGLQRGFGWGGQKTIGSDGTVFGAMTSEEGPNTFPTFGQVTDNTGKQFEKAAESIPVVGSGVRSARNAAKEGIKQSVETGLSELSGSPITGPVDKDITAGRIGSEARATNIATQGRLSAEQQALEDAVGRGSRGEASPIAKTITELSQSPETGVNISRSLDPRAADLQAQIARTTDPNPAAGAVGPPAPEITYGAAKDLRGDMRDRAAAAPPLTGYYLDKGEGAYTDFMRGVAERQGQGDFFDAANQRYAKFKNVQQPWLEQQGGELGGTPHVPAAGTISGIIGSGSGPQYLSDIATHIGPDVARSTLADVLSRIGQQNKEFSPSTFGKNYGVVNDASKAFIDQQASAATPYLENAATGGRAFDLNPERPGMSNSMGYLASALQTLAKFPKIAATVGGGMETPSVIRAMAGRTDIPAIVAQYALRQGLLAGRR